MTTISGKGTNSAYYSALANPPRFSDMIDGRGTLKWGEPSAEEKARSAQMDAEAAALKAASEKQQQEIEKGRHIESHEMYLPNISSLSLENAKKSVGIVEGMIRDHQDAGMNVNGRYGDQDISDLNTYLAGLKDFISKCNKSASSVVGAPATGAKSTGSAPAADPLGLHDAVSLSNKDAVSVYRQMQDMVATPTLNLDAGAD